MVGLEGSGEMSWPPPRIERLKPVLPFTSPAHRDLAWPAPDAGDLAYVLDANALSVFTDGKWKPVHK